jgi:5'(3')-deoxyribonucleotidase
MKEATHPGIGVDLDIATQLLRFIRLSLGINLSPDALTSEDIETCTPVTRDQLVSFFCNPTFFRTIPAFVGARRMLNVLRSRGYRLHIITDRFWYEGLRQDTEQWLHLHRLPFDSLRFARKSEKKYLVSELGLQWFVEDQLSNANALSEHCHVVLLDRSYNRGPQADAVERVDSLQQAVHLILHPVVKTPDQGTAQTQIPKRKQHLVYAATEKHRRARNAVRSEPRTELTDV